MWETQMPLVWLVCFLTEGKKKVKPMLNSTYLQNSQGKRKSEKKKKKEMGKEATGFFCYLSGESLWNFGETKWREL